MAAHGTSYAYGHLRAPGGATLLRFDPDLNPALHAALAPIGSAEVTVQDQGHATVDGVAYTVTRSRTELLQRELPPEGTLPTAAQLRARARRLCRWLRQPAEHTAEECGDELLRLLRQVHRVLEGREKEE